MNTILTIVGNVTKDPQIKIGRADGQPFAIVSVAVNDRNYDRGAGQWLTTGTTYYDLVCFGTLGANAAKCLKTGDPVIAVGRFRVKEWESDNGRGKTATMKVDSLGPDLRRGTARYTKGSMHYGVDPVDAALDGVDPPAEEAEPEPEPDEDQDEPELSTLADENGEVNDEQAEKLLRRSA